MALKLEQFHVADVQFAERTELVRGVLRISSGELRDELMRQDERIAAMDIELVKPGESARVVCVKDVVEPRINPDGRGRGEGRLWVLKGVAVATCGPIVGFQEGIIDMSGPGAGYTPFSRLPLVVIRIEPAGGVGPHEHEEAVRDAGLRAAEFLAGAAAGASPDSVEMIDWQPLAGEDQLPAVAYVYMVLSQGLLHDTYVCGENAREGLPRLIDPQAVAANGIVSGNCVSACDKNTTFHHQNNPVIRELLEGHGERWNFVGIVVTNEPVRLEGKEQSAARAVDLVRQLGADGAVITKEGFGNPDADLMMLIRGLEAAGVKTVAITDEFAGTEGASQSLADTAVEADAIVSTGNANARVALPAMDRTIGRPDQLGQLAGADAKCGGAGGGLEVELQLIMGATNQLGFSRLSCRDVQEKHVTVQ